MSEQADEGLIEYLQTKNLEYENILKEIIVTIQGGKWGEPTLEMLNFCGKIHVALHK